MSFQMYLNTLANNMRFQTYTRTLYVSQTGNNNGGLTWETAFTTIQAAVVAASASALEFTCIMIGPGAYDVLTNGGLIIAKQITLRGVALGAVTVTNTGGGGAATNVFNCTNHFEMENLAILHNDLVGVLTNNALCDNSVITNCTFISAGSAAPAVGIDVTAGAAIRILNCIMLGIVGWSVGIDMNSEFCIIDDCKILDCLSGISLTAATSDANTISRCTFLRCATGFIGGNAGAEWNTLIDCIWSDCVANYVDADNTTNVINPKANRTTHIAYPVATGVQALLSGGAGVLGNYAEVIAVNTVLSPLRIKSIGLDTLSAAADTYTIEISYVNSFGANVAIASVATFGLPANQTIPINECPWIPARCRVDARLASTTGADTANIHISIEAL